MKLCFFHLMPYQDLPDSFEKDYHSVWVDAPNRLFDPEKGHHMYNDFLGELEYAEAVAETDPGLADDMRRSVEHEMLKADAKVERGAIAAESGEIDDAARAELEATSFHTGHPPGEPAP